MPSLAPRAIGGDALVRHPHAARHFPCLPEHIDRYAAARMKIAADAQPFGLEQRDQPPADRNRAVLMEHAMIAEILEITLERFRFHPPAAGHIIDDKRREIRLAGNGADRGEFWKGEARDIIAVRMGIGHAVQHSVARRGRGADGAAELGRFWHCETCGFLSAAVTLSPKK